MRVDGEGPRFSVLYFTTRCRDAMRVVPQCRMC